MIPIGKIKIRDLKELQEMDAVLPKNALTPLRKRKNPKSTTTTKKINNKLKHETVMDDIALTTTHARTTKKISLKFADKETPCNQKRIDSYFTSCPKNYNIKFPKEEPPTTFGKSTKQTAKNTRKTSANKRSRQSTRRPSARRKRLFTDSTELQTETMSILYSIKGSSNLNDVECITIVSDSDNENNIKKDIDNPTNQTVAIENIPSLGSSSIGQQHLARNNCSDSMRSASPTTASSLSFGQRMSTTSCGRTKSTSTSSGVSKRKPKPCPSYKIIEDTTFAVDAFQFGYIENVTHYFLTHFHADHYIGLTKSFSMPLYMSPITARLLRSFIPVQEKYINELELNRPYTINDVEVTALDANHCPGSILLVFKFLDTGKCILHTGDFRASHEMESEPIFWNNDIHTIYLDTTYISDKYAFCTQYESIMKAQSLIEKFNEKHAGKRILYVCGSYIIGKEKFWASLAEKYEMKVWAEGNRYKALKAIDDERFNRLLVRDANDANMHVIPMGKLSYLELVEYSKLYEHQYDVIFAIRPSGWEKDTKPRYGSKINMVGIEYSEHSSYEEMQRFVKFLKPANVISTVPSGRDLMKTSKVPLNWYKYYKLKASSNYQPSIDSFLGSTLFKTNTAKRLSNVNKSRLEKIVSPLKPASNVNSNNLDHDKAFSLMSPVYAEQNEGCEDINENIKEEIFSRKPTKNLHSHKNTARSNTNSSEYFEKSDLISTTKKQPRKPQLQEKTKSNSTTKRKEPHNKNQLQPKNNNIKLNTIVSEAMPLMKPNKKNNLKNKIKKIAKNEIEMGKDKTANSSSQHYSSEVEYINLRKNVQNPSHEILNKQDYETPISQKRITRSQKALNELNRISPALQNKPEENSTTGLIELTRYPTRSRKNDIYNKSATNSTRASDSNDEPHVNYAIIKENYVAKATKQKTTLRSQTASIETTSNLSKKTFDSNSKLNPPTNTNTIQLNPIFKSFTESTIDPTSGDEMNMKHLKTKAAKMKSTTSSENWLDDFEFKFKTVPNKRHALTHSLTSLKRTKANIDTQTILKSILEQGEDIDRFNCSQLAGLVVETVNAQNPDYSKNHIPVDLLSDADDDWM